jgi:hypothetical protein
VRAAEWATRTRGGALLPPPATNSEEWPALSATAAAAAASKQPPPVQQQEQQQQEEEQPPKPRLRPEDMEEEEEEAWGEGPSPLKPSLLLPHLIPTTAAAPSLLQPLQQLGTSGGAGAKAVGGRSLFLPTLVEEAEAEDEEEAEEEAVAPGGGALFRLDSPLLRGHGEPALLSFDAVFDLAGPVRAEGEEGGVEGAWAHEEERFSGISKVPLSAFKRQAEEDPGACCVLRVVLMVWGGLVCVLDCPGFLRRWSCWMFVFLLSSSPLSSAFH